MATGGLNVFRENAVYIAGGKESVWGTGVPATWGWYWLDGSDANPEAKLQSEREGDTSPFKALTWKQGQYEVIKIVEYVHPILAGYALQALCGTSSDTYTAPTVNTTLSAAILAGATQCQVAANLGATGTAVCIFEPGYTSTTWEIATLDLTTKAGTGPYTYTLANAATFQKGHSNAGIVQSASTHAFTRKGAYDPYSIEIGWNTDGGTLQKAVRYIDCVCADLKITSEKGKKLKFEHTWYATGFSNLGTFTLPPYETNRPMTHYDANGKWQLNNAATLNALTIDKFDVTFKNSTTPDDCQSEGLNPVYFLPGNCDISGSYEVLFNDWGQYELTYAGARTFTSGAGDSAIVGQEALLALWQPDLLNSLQVSLPNVFYSAAKLTPRLDAKPLPQPVTFEAINNRPAGVTNAFTVTLANSQANSY
ncbi:MAG TPA: hypothetical protein VKQ30_01205 [Ktedonobacterales bacterium]|nr:hypothetical protein [Ktedonobacterales bacterium]